MIFDTSVLFHGTRNRDVLHLRASKSGEFGPGVYLTSFEPTAEFYAQRVAQGPDEPTVFRVITDVTNPFVVTKSQWQKMTIRSTPLTVQKKLCAKNYDSIIGIANNGYEWQMIVFDPKYVHIIERKSLRGR